MITFSIWGDTLVDVEAWQEEVHLNLVPLDHNGKKTAQGRVGYINVTPAAARDMAKALIKAAAVADIRARAKEAAEAEVAAKTDAEIEAALLADLDLPKGESA